MKLGIFTGTTKVDPGAYDGWAGECPGCDLDAIRFYELSRKQGVAGALLLDAHVTRANVRRVYETALTELDPSKERAFPLLVLYNSGHGGQQPDVSGDEEDGKDETLCLYDGELNDDDIRSFLALVSPGQCLFYITDTCNSGTNYRARGTKLHSTPVSFERVVPEEFRGQLIHFGGCADGKRSYGSDEGGEFTNALLRTFRPGLGYREWFEAAAAKMPRNQVPVYAEYGEVTDAFRAGPVFS